MASFADLKSEALKGQPETEPYTLDDVTPPIKITAPTDLERTIGLAELVGVNGEFEIKNARLILELLCGDAFDAVWQLCRKQHISVMTGLVSAILRHFKADLDLEAASLPGGSGASSI